MKKIGKVSQIISMTNYFCTIFREGEIDSVPKSDDYLFGTLVKIEAKGGTIVGIITDVTTLTPGDRIPLKVPEMEQAMRLYPTFYSSIQTIIVVSYLGMIKTAGGQQEIVHSFPGIIPDISASIWTMDDPEIVSFHKPRETLTFGYYSRFSQEPNFEYAFCALCDRMMRLLPEEQALVRKLKQNVEFLSKVNGFSRGRR